MSVPANAHPIERAFIRRPVASAVAATVAFVALTGGLRAAFTVIIPDGAHQDQVAAGMQQLVLALITVGVIARVGWLRSARITSRPRWPRSRWALTILPAAIIPLVGLGAVDWSQTAQIGASSFDFLTTGLVEEVMCRSFIMTGLAIGFRGRSSATLRVVLWSSLLFGLAHLNPVVVVFAAVFGFSFAHLALAANTIWIGVVVHGAFDLFTDLPDSTNGNTHWSIAPALAIVVAGGIVAVLRARKPEIEFQSQ